MFTASAGKGQKNFLSLSLSLSLVSGSGGSERKGMLGRYYKTKCWVTAATAPIAVAGGADAGRQVLSRWGKCARDPGRAALSSAILWGT